LNNNFYARTEVEKYRIEISASSAPLRAAILKMVTVKGRPFYQPVDFKNNLT
jgi:hypothetical protein